MITIVIQIVMTPGSVITTIIDIVGDKHGNANVVESRPMMTMVITRVTKPGSGITMVTETMINPGLVITMVTHIWLGDSTIDSQHAVNGEA